MANKLIPVTFGLTKYEKSLLRACADFYEYTQVDMLRKWIHGTARMIVEEKDWAEPPEPILLARQNLVEVLLDELEEVEQA